MPVSGSEAKLQSQIPRMLEGALLKSPSGLYPQDLLWQGGDGRDRLGQSNRFYPKTKCRRENNRNTT